MPVIRQKWIIREDLKSNRERVYVFGDNMIRIGYGGQAKSMRGEPNAYGIPTKWMPDDSDDSFFCDDDFDDPSVTFAISGAFVHLAEVLNNGYDVVIPTDGLGTGLSKLSEKAPLIAKFIDEQIAKLEEKYGLVGN